MGRFKKNQRVVVNVEKDNFKAVGVISEIRKGLFDKSTGKYTVDIYVVKDDANGDSIYCNKCDLQKIEESSVNGQQKKNTEEVYQRMIQVGDRVVTVVGIKKELKDNSQKPNRKRQISFGHSICHPTDSFNEQEGYRLAYNRAKRTNKILSTNSWTMLQKDQCNMLVQNEAEYIANNIEKYIR